MSEHIDKAQLISHVAKHLSKSPAEIDPVADALLEEIYEALKREESVSPHNFDTFMCSGTGSRSQYATRSSKIAWNTLCCHRGNWLGTSPIPINEIPDQVPK